MLKDLTISLRRLPGQLLGVNKDQETLNDISIVESYDFRGKYFESYRQLELGQGTTL